MNDLIEHLEAGRELTPEQVGAAVTNLTLTEYDDTMKARLLRALSTKGVTPAELAAFATGFLERALPLPLDRARLGGPLIDVCGTGGDRLGLFNISTTVAFVLAAGGVVVAKHGNRGVSSRSGGADVLETLGVPLDPGPEKAAANLIDHGIAFLFAQRYHPAFKAVSGVRRKLAEEGIVTVFNSLGPLLNPARPDYQLAGLARRELLPAYAEVLGLLGRRRAWVVNGWAGAADDAGMDEMSILGPTWVAEFERGRIERKELEPSPSVGRAQSLQPLVGGSATENGEIVVGVLSGTICDERREMVVWNAAGGFVVAELAANLEEGIALAREVLGSGAALNRLKALQHS